MTTTAENFTAHCRDASDVDIDAFSLLKRPRYTPVFSIPFKHPVPWHLEENRETALYSIVRANRLLRWTAEAKGIFTP